jgi:superfamily I DNA and/or RNA helicase
VNFAEAQAVVRTLEAMAAKPADWPGLEGAAGNANQPVVAVLALFPSQVDLLRGLVRQSTGLKGAGFTLVIDEPAALREQEVAMVLLSLTRSHAHRPITYGEGPDLLTLALTRARSQVVLFGDPGSLARRSQWEGPLDHLDEATAAREREVIVQLVQYLQGQGPYPHAFLLREGAGS